MSKIWEEVDARDVARADRFRVTRFVGRAKYEDGGTYLTLDEARAVKIAMGKDPYGRGAMIYAITEGGRTIFVE